MPTTAPLTPLRPLPTLPSGQPSATGRPVSAVRGIPEVPSSLESFNFFPWMGDENDFRDSQEGNESFQQGGVSAPERQLRPDEEFFKLSALFSPLADGFSVIGQEAAKSEKSVTFLSYLPVTDMVEGIGVYEMNSRIVQGLMRPAGASFDYVL